MRRSENKQTEPTQPVTDAQPTQPKRKQRAKGKGTIIKRGNTYFGRWVVAGKVHTSTLKTSSYKDAEAALREKMKLYVARDEAASLENAVARLSKAREAVQKMEAQEDAVSIRAAFVAFKARMPSTAAETLSMYESQFARFEEWVSANEPDCKLMNAVTPLMAQRFMDGIAAKFSANTHNKYLSLMRLIWKKLSKQIQAESDPWTDIERKPVRKSGGRRALTVEELSKVCGLLDGEMKVLFALGIYTGLRLADCALLKWEALDFPNRLLHVLPLKTAKTGRIITVSLHPTLEKLLSGVERGDSPYVLPDAAELYSRNNSELVKRVQAVFEKAGIKTRAEVSGYSRKVTEVGFHSLRHTFVSLCGNGGLPLAYIQSIVGHSNPMMTSHYFHGDAEAHRLKLVAALPDIIDTPKVPTSSQYDEAVRLVESLTDEERARLALHLASRK